MTQVERLVPDAAVVELEAQLALLTAAPLPEAFSELAIDLCDAVGRFLFRNRMTRDRPDLIALASWLRRANMQRIAAGRPAGAIPVARGLVFHVPPANVETIAMYSLALSILAGNSNVVRISARAGEGTRQICAALDAVLSEPRFAPIRASTALLSWAHESEATQLCSANCDVRVIWGGDAVVQSIRALPLRPGAKDVPFVDRFSLAALRSEAWLSAGEIERTEVARRLFNDGYWFDQQGCSSPRLLVWCGDAEGAIAASDDLFSRLAGQVHDHGYELQLGAVTGKLAWVAGAAIDRPLHRVRSWGNELTVLTLRTLDGLDRQHPGAGTFLETCLPQLSDLASHVAPRDQTLTVYGFDRGELECFVRRAAGRGVDRIVPFGEALRFEHRWDGIDLLTELTRHVVISPDAADSILGARR